MPFALVNASTGAALTGATVTTKITKDGAAQVSAAGSVSELGNGEYLWSPSQADTNANSLGVLFTSTGAIPVHFTIFTTAADPTDSVRFGLTALPNAAAEAAGGLYTRGTGAGQINQPANGQIDTNPVKINGNAAAAVRLALSAGVIIPGTVATAGFTPTTIEFEASDITTAAAQHYNGRVIVFTSGTLLGQATSISNYSLSGGRGHFTVVALTSAPSNADTFIVI